MSLCTSAKPLAAPSIQPAAPDESEARLLRILGAWLADMANAHSLGDLQRVLDISGHVQETNCHLAELIARRIERQ